MTTMLHTRHESHNKLVSKPVAAQYIDTGKPALLV